MFINRNLLLGVILLLSALPLLSWWLSGAYWEWYRPYLLWTLVIVGAWWGHRSRHPDEL